MGAIVQDFCLHNVVPYPSSDKSITTAGFQVMSERRLSPDIAKCRTAYYQIKSNGLATQESTTGTWEQENIKNCEALPTNIIVSCGVSQR